jgi:hypothetical protein
VRVGQLGGLEGGALGRLAGGALRKREGGAPEYFTECSLFS